MTTGLVEVGRHELRVSVRGDLRRPGPPPLLLISGIGATMDLFEPLRAHLGERPTIAFDAPGVGGSPTPRAPLAMGQLADLAAGLLDALGVAEADVLGLSWGGAMAQEVARRHGRRVRRLVLVATMHGVTSVPGHPMAVAVLATPLRYYSRSFLEAVSPVLYGREVHEHRDLLRRHAHLRTARPPSVLGYLWQLAALASWSSRGWLGSLPHPTLVLAGDEDPIVPVANGRAIADLLPRGRLEVVRGGGHLFVFLRAAAVAALIAAFLDSPDPVIPDAITTEP